MPAPTNVLLEKPTIEDLVSWENEENKWIELNREIGGHREFYPLTIKGAYVIGIIFNICTCVSTLLHSPPPPSLALKQPVSKHLTYVTAYGLFASAIDILGRCVCGNHSATRGSIREGFKWLAASDASYEQIQEEQCIVKTSREYSVDNLVQLRHFANHGQAVSKSWEVDFSLLNKLRPVLANRLDVYWTNYLKTENGCNNLAKANILALRPDPIFSSWMLFERDETGRYFSVEEIFNRFNWEL